MSPAPGGAAQGVSVQSVPTHRVVHSMRTPQQTVAGVGDVKCYGKQFSLELDVTLCAPTMPCASL